MTMELCSSKIFC